MVDPQNAFRFVNKRVLVTGGGSGIGATVAEAFGSAGAQVAIHYSRNGDGANAVATRLRSTGAVAHTLQGDLLVRSVPAALVERATQTLGGLDILLASLWPRGVLRAKAVNQKLGQVSPRGRLVVISTTVVQRTEPAC